MPLIPSSFHSRPNQMFDLMEALWRPSGGLEGWRAGDECCLSSSSSRLRGGPSAVPPRSPHTLAALAALAALAVAVAVATSPPAAISWTGQGEGVV